MKKIIIDTSTIVEASAGRKTRNKSLELLIEALVIYDNIYYDQISISNLLIDENKSNNFAKIPHDSNRIRSIIKNLKPLKIADEEVNKIERIIHESVGVYLKNIKLLKKHLNVKIGKKFKREFNEIVLDKIFADQIFPRYMRYSNCAISLKDFDSNPELYKSLTSNLIRIFYYQSLQEIFKVHYIPNPLRSKYYHFNEDRLYAKEILKYYKEKVKDNYYRRLKEIANFNSIYFDYPIVSSYIIEKSTSFEDIIERTMELRMSREAILFRNTIEELEEALNRSDIILVDKILHNIEKSAKAWSQNLGLNVKSRKVNIGIPFIGLAESEFDIPIPKINLKKEDHIMVFAHKILKNE